MNSFFTKLKHFGGLVIGLVIGGLDKADKTIDADAPEIEKVLTEGSSIAQLIPGVGPEVAAALNLGTELTGALKTTLDATDADFAKLQATAQAAIPAGSGYTAVLVADELVSEAKAWFAQIEEEVSQAKVAVTAVTGKTAPTVPPAAPAN